MLEKLRTLYRAAIATTLAIAALCFPAPLAAQARVEKNVIFGMYSGLALLMDVHRPEKPNGLGIVFISGSGWTSRIVYGAPSLKEQQIGDWSPNLLAAGYTLFAINHRSTPRFHYPAPVEDVQRAIRYIRRNASQYGIDPAKLGGMGGSSGGHLIGLVAMLGAGGIAGDPDPVNREPATLQCVVLRAAPADMQKMIGGSTLATAAVTAFVGRLPMPSPEDREVYRAASPISHVSAKSPPTLLMHGDADDTVPFQQSVDMEAALGGMKVPVRLVRVAGGAHGSDFGMSGKPHAQFSSLVKEPPAWFDQYLKASK